LIQEKNVKRYEEVMDTLVTALESIASIDDGKKACLDAGAVSALISLYQCYRARNLRSYQWLVMMNQNTHYQPNYIMRVIIQAFKSLTGNDIDLINCTELVHQLRLGSATFSYFFKEIKDIVSTDAGIQACIDANVPSVIVSLFQERNEKGYDSVAGSIIDVLTIIASTEAGIQACIDTNALSASIAFLCENYNEIDQYFYTIHQFLTKIALSDVGKQACLVADIPLAMRSFQLRVKEIEAESQYIYNRGFDDGY
jgi:hypothetical protein